jgi:hypothetical protein
MQLPLAAKQVLRSQQLTAVAHLSVESFVVSQRHHHQHMSAASTGVEAPLMNGNVIDGKAVAARIRAEVAAEVAEMKATHKRVSCCRSRSTRSPGT